MSRRLPALVLPLLLVVVAALMLTVGTTAADPTGGVWTLSQNGFGEHENSYAWSMNWFDGKLYVGTGRDVLCVENETNQYFVPLRKGIRPIPPWVCGVRKPRTT